MAGADIGPAVDPKMAVLTNRLPFMNLTDLCEENNYTYAVVWRPSRSQTPGVGEVLKVDRESSHGEFAAQSAKFEFKEGEGLPGICFQKKDVHHLKNLQAASEDPRRDVAGQCGVAGAFAIWRDGAVWEFGGSPPMEDEPTELIGSFGGSTGVKAAAKAVQAVVRLGAMAKASKQQ